MRSLYRSARKPMGKAVKKSEKKFSRAAVKRAEETRVRYDSLVESSDDAIITMNPEGVILAWNTSAERMFGYSEAEAMGQPITLIIPPALRDEETDILKRVRAGERIGHYETRRVSKDGKTTDVSITVSPLRDAGCKITGVSHIARDITESNWAEAVLRESLERFRSVANTAPVMIWMSDVDKLCTYFNQRWLEFTGRALAAGLGNGWAEAVHPGDLPGCLEIYTKAFDRREPFQMEYRLRRHDGEYRWILDHAVPRFNADRSFAGYIGSGIDVTDRKRAEEALQKSDERLRLSMEAGKSVGWDWDVRSGRDSLFGDLATVFGIPAEIYDGRVEDFHRYIHPEDRTWVLKTIDQAMETHESYEAEFRILWPDSTVRWLAARGRFRYSKDGEAERMLGVAVDITDRKFAEEKLQEYERAVEGAGEMIVVVDREYRYRIANNEFVKMRNMTKEQVVGRFAHEVLNQGVFESVVKEKLDECFQGKVVRFEMKYTYPKLGERDILISYFPIEGATGIDRVACIVRDITERKLAEEALSTVSQKLIGAQEQERTRIARELHDDINQRLALLAVQLDGLKTAEVRKQIEDLASDIQELSHRLHSAKLEYLGLEAAVASFCRELSDRQGVEIGFQSKNIPKDLPQEVSLTLFRVLQEALQNAVKHSGSRHFQVSLTGGANAIELTAHDSGIGFEPREAIKGRGLGLTSMQERLRLIDGQLSIDSKPQYGTTVRVRVPFHPRTKSAGQVGT